jgi:3'(2'), 5'-bisphosphate nucleotidase
MFSGLQNSSTYNQHLQTLPTGIQLIWITYLQSKDETPMDLQPILRAVRQGMTLCREVQKTHITRNEKGGHEPVTIADYGTQAIVNQAIMRHFPGDAIISEESGQQFSTLVTSDQQKQVAQLVSAILGESVTVDTLVEWLDYGKVSDDTITPARTWLVDPVDGTKGFLAGRHYVIAVGFMRDSQPHAAVVGAPAYPNTEKGVLFHAIDGAAYAHVSGNGETNRMYVSHRTDAADARALESVEKGHVGLERLARVRHFAGISNSLVEQADSQEKYARIAAGDADIYMRLSRLKSTRPHFVWDHMPGALLVTNAGGIVTGLDGEPLDFTQGKTLQNKGVIATNGAYHNRILEGVHSLLEEEAATQ